jgi:hypothetical protein
MSTENSLLENDEPVNKKEFSNGSKSVEGEKFYVKRVEMTLLILKHYIFTVFDICISDKFLDKDQSFQDTLHHKHHNIYI